MSYERNLSILRQSLQEVETEIRMSLYDDFRNLADKIVDPSQDFNGVLNLQQDCTSVTLGLAEFLTASHLTLPIMAIGDISNFPDLLRKTAKDQFGDLLTNHEYGEDPIKDLMARKAHLTMLWADKIDSLI